MRNRNQKNRKPKNSFAKKNKEFIDDSDATIANILYHQMEAFRILFRFSKRAKTHVKEQRHNYYESIKRAFRRPPPPRTLVLGSFGGVILVAVFCLGLANRPKHSPEVIDLATDLRLKTADDFVRRSKDYLERRKFDEACRISEEGLKLFPSDVSMIAVAADCAECVGRFQRALTIISNGRPYVLKTDESTQRSIRQKEERYAFYLKQMREAPRLRNEPAVSPQRHASKK